MTTKNATEPAAVRPRWFMRRWVWAVAAAVAVLAALGAITGGSGDVCVAAPGDGATIELAAGTWQLVPDDDGGTAPNGNIGSVSVRNATGRVADQAGVVRVSPTGKLVITDGGTFTMIAAAAAGIHPDDIRELCFRPVAQ